ncbi:MAG TPA: hypothetical protein VKR23_16080 [Gaiellaceae bacterium]|nr:hypothetical protein [Gaiellaceae bacterium]
MPEQKIPEFLAPERVPYASVTLIPAPTHFVPWDDSSAWAVAVCGQRVHANERTEGRAAPTCPACVAALAETTEEVFGNEGLSSVPGHNPRYDRAYDTPRAKGGK